MIKFLRLFALSTILTLSLSTLAFNQTKFLTGRVVDEELNPIVNATVRNYDLINETQTDSEGSFRVSLLPNTKCLSINLLGYETTAINLSLNFKSVDIILMNHVTYDYTSLKAINRKRKRRLDNLLTLHLLAYKKGVFTTDKPCYQQTFLAH